MPSERIIRNQELIQIGTMYAVLLIGLITAGAGLLGIFSVITTPVALLYLIGAGISILSGRSIATVPGNIFGKNSHVPETGHFT
jgi:hypothetical protein